MKLSVIIPMYNESGRIANTARQLCSVLREDFPGDFEIIFCDDGSTDGSAAEVEKLGFPEIRVVSYQPNRGKGYAVRRGMLESRGEVAMFTDADLAYGTGVFSRFVEEFENDGTAGCVFGSRNIGKDGYDGYSFIRKIASKCYLKVLSVVGGLKQTDSQCGCKAFRGDAARAIFSVCETDRFAFDFEVIMIAEKLGYRITELPVRVINHGESKVHVLRDTFRMLKDLRRIRKRVGKPDSGRKK